VGANYISPKRVKGFKKVENALGVNYFLSFPLKGIFFKKRALPLIWGSSLPFPLKGEGFNIFKGLFFSYFSSPFFKFFPHLIFPSFPFLQLFFPGKIYLGGGGKRKVKGWTL